VSSAKRFDNMERMRYLISGIKSGSMYWGVLWTGVL
jgi:hypothetical protein